MVMILRDFMLLSCNNWKKIAEAAESWRSYLNFDRLVRAMASKKLLTVNTSQAITCLDPMLKNPKHGNEGEEEEDKQFLLEAFHTMDKNGDGVITIEELNAHLAKIGVPLDPEESAHMAASLLPLAHGMRFEDFQEFYEKSVTIMHDMGDDDDFVALKEAFDVFDVNNDGFISVEELRHVVPLVTGSDYQVDWESALARFDANSDGLIDLSEFCTMMTHTRSSTLD